MKRIPQLCSFICIATLGEKAWLNMKKVTAIIEFTPLSSVLRAAADVAEPSMLIGSASCECVWGITDPLEKKDFEEEGGHQALSHANTKLSHANSIIYSFISLLSLSANRRSLARILLLRLASLSSPLLPPHSC